MPERARKLLVLVNLGTPKAPTPEAVHEFLLEFLSDPGVIDLPRRLWQPILRRMVLRSRPARVAELYRSIWLPEGSPLEVGTKRIAAGVERIAASIDTPSGGGFEVAWAYRYGEPSLASVLGERVGDATDEVAILPLYAHHTSSTSESVFLEAERAGGEMGISEKLRRIELAPDAPGFIEALADRCRAAFAAAGFEPEHLLVSYHGIPTRYDRRERGRYSRGCKTTTRALLAALDWPAARATHCYQSKFGPEPWLKPATAGLLQELPSKGVRKLAVVTPAFLTEGLETIEEIGIQGKETFEHAGGEAYLRVPTTEDHPALLRALVQAAFASAS